MREDDDVEIGKLREARFDLRLVGDIEMRGRDLAEARRLHASLRITATTREDGRALVRECFRARSANAARAAGDDREFAEQSFHGEQYTRDVKVIALLLVLLGIAHADDKALRPYAGRIVISPDSPPTSVDELPAFLKANATSDNTYDLIKGPPWPFHFAAILKKDYKSVTLVVSDGKTQLISISLTPARRIVLAQVEATEAAGFASEKMYRVELRAGKTIVAKCQLKLRP